MNRIWKRKDFGEVQKTLKKDGEFSNKKQGKYCVLILHVWSSGLNYLSKFVSFCMHGGSVTSPVKRLRDSTICNRQQFVGWKKRDLPNSIN